MTHSQLGASKPLRTASSVTCHVENLAGGTIVMPLQSQVTGRAPKGADEVNTTTKWRRVAC
jgi:hypothetical protein